MIYFCTNKRKFLFFVVFLIIAFIFLAAFSYNKESKKLDTDNKKINYINSLGYKVDSTETFKIQNITLPLEFSDVYENYNELQKECGFDLSDYKGTTLVQYKIKLKNADGRDDIYAHLLLYNNRLVGGDISTTAFDGYMKGLEKCD